jgi:hypothetical protein
MYQTQLLDNRNRAHLDQAAELLLQGEIIAFGFNGIFVFIGNADQAIAARRIAAAKRQPLDKPLALVCAPEYLEEFVDLDAPALRYHPFDKVQQLQREVYSLGVLLPVSRTNVPAYMTHNGTDPQRMDGVSAPPPVTLFAGAAPRTWRPRPHRQLRQSARRADLSGPPAHAARLWRHDSGDPRL